MISATFYSYKGGVGRTLALLNTAKILAGRNHRVLVVDLDLEAPGIGLAGATQSDLELGFSDLLLSFKEQTPLGIDRCCYPKEGLFFMKAGRRRGELAERLPELVGKNSSPDPWNYFFEEAATQLRPDFILFDSRTGRTNIAAVALLYLADAAFLLAGLNDQNVLGMKAAFHELTHDLQPPDRWLPFLVLSPVPTDASLISEPRAAVNGNLWGQVLASQAPILKPQNLVDKKVYWALGQLEPIYTRYQATLPRWPDAPLTLADAVTELPYHPLVPLLDEFEVAQKIPELRQAYERLAAILERTAKP